MTMKALSGARAESLFCRKTTSWQPWLTQDSTGAATVPLIRFSLSRKAVPKVTCLGANACGFTEATSKARGGAFAGSPAILTADHVERPSAN